MTNNKLQNNRLGEALGYADLGWSIIPIKPYNKESLVEWKKYQNVRASKEQITEWFEQYPDANIAVVTGAISGIVVIDIDTKEKINRPIPPTVVSQTPSGGRHIFCKYPGFEVKNRVRILPNVDIRADGGYVVLPPSSFSSELNYGWIIPPTESEFADLPQWFFEDNKTTIKTEWENVSTKQTLDGSRNQTATQLIGKMLKHLPKDSWEMSWFAIKQWNKEKCEPSLAEAELKTIFNSISNRETEQRAKEGIEKTDYKIEAVTFSDLIKTEYKDTQWLVEKLIPHEAVTIISGSPRSYKTFVALDIAIKIASGEKLFNKFNTKQSSVLILDEENHPRILKQRAEILSQKTNLPIFFSSKKNFLLNEKSTREVIRFSKEKDIKLVIFDSLICIHDSDENMASEMRKVMKNFKEITNHGISAIVLHHHRKKGNSSSSASQDMRGSSDILAQVDVHLAVDRRGNDASITIQQNKLREAQEMEPFIVNFRSDGDKGYFEYGGARKGKTDKKESLRKEIISSLENSSTPPSKTELWKLVKENGIKAGHSTFKTVIENMVEEKEVTTKKGNKNSVLCSLTKLGADDG